VGGDVYDVLPLEDGRVAVCLGDVVGKGIEAAADMAMAKFTFRALARLYPEPSAFLARANDVVVEEIALGKFVTMVYAVLDPATGELACANAGHPPFRLVRPDGGVQALPGPGLALGIDAGQAYEEERISLPPGASVVLFTDGVIETRRDGDLYGEGRLDAFLAAAVSAELGAQELADALVADCRAFGGGELDDDCAVVCLRLAP
jgi:serine phosphatase RsbU (regulator of sigma subunit)